MGCGAGTERREDYKFSDVASTRCPSREYAAPSPEFDSVSDDDVSVDDADDDDDGHGAVDGDCSTSGASPVTNIDEARADVIETALEIKKAAVEYGAHCTRLPVAMFEENSDFNSMDASPMCSVQVSVRAYQLQKNQQIEDFLNRVQTHFQDSASFLTEEMDPSKAKLNRKKVCRRLDKLVRNSNALCAETPV